MAKAPRIPVLHIFHNQDAELYLATVREDKVYLKNEKVAQFINRGVFTVQCQKKMPKRFKALIYLDGKAETAHLSNEEYQKFTETVGEKIETSTQDFQTIPLTEEKIFEPLTDKDRQTVVKREIAKQLGKFRPMETWQFFVIIGMIVGVYVLTVLFR
jgi:hypothetical protein